MSFPSTRLVFFDMDGTFVDNQHKQPAPGSYALMDSLRQRGVGFVPCTGRGFLGVSCYPGLMERCLGAICYDGGLILDARPPGTVPRILRRLGLAAATYRELIRLLAGGLQTDDALVVFRDEEMHLLNIPPEMAANLSVWGSRPIHGGLQDFEGIDDPQLAIYYGPDERVELIHAVLTSLPDAPIQTIRYESDVMGRTGLILKHRDTHKGAALRWFAGQLGVDIADTLGIGDWLNDLTMLRDAGVGVAMKNARPEVKAVADRETRLDNNEAGAIEFLREYFGL